MASNMIIVFLVIVQVLTDHHDIIVNLMEGSVKGVLEKSIGGKKFYSFYGIPYALPPVGKRRFMRPEPVQSWTSLKDKEIIECAQEYTGREDLIHWGGSVRGLEDCLVLNVYTPEVGEDTK